MRYKLADIAHAWNVVFWPLVFDSARAPYEPLVAIFRQSQSRGMDRHDGGQGYWYIVLVWIHTIFDWLHTLLVLLAQGLVNRPFFLKMKLYGKEYVFILNEYVK
jgi:hypothetical protein